MGTGSRMVGIATVLLTVSCSGGGNGPTLTQIEELWGVGDETLTVTSRQTEAIGGEETVLVLFEATTADGRTFECGTRFSLSNDEWMGSEADCAILGFAPVDVAGETLPPFEQSGNDPAVGLIAPTLTGQDTEGTPIELGPDGQAKVLLFVTHWCPQCPEALTEAQQVMNADAAPGGVAVYAIHTLGDPELPDWPPATLLEAGSWELPTMVDSEVNTAAAAYGVLGVPAYVVVDASNRVVSRHAGKVGAEALRTMLEAAAN